MSQMAVSNYMQRLAYRRAVLIEKAENIFIAQDAPATRLGETSKVAIEIKIDGSCSEVTRQIHRYSQHPDVEEILLITTCAKHLRIKNGRIHSFAGKQFFTLWTGGTAGL
jgi:hypothetical protein